MVSPQVLEGSVIAAFFGLFFGNFATNPIYRLPRRESLFLKDPYCGDCNHILTAKDLFPVVSLVMTRGRCRYCGARVPMTYAGFEGLIGLLYVICYLKTGFSENFVLAGFAATAFIMIAMMLYLDNFFSGKTLIATLFLGMLYRTLHDQSIYPAAGGAFAGLIIGGSAWWISKKNLIREISAFPPYMCLLIAAGVWLPLKFFFIACLVAGACVPLKKEHPWIVEWSIIIYVVIMMLTRLN